MKIRTTLPLFCTLCFLMISAASSSAQITETPLTPIDVRFSLDTTFLTYDLHETVIQSHRINGSIQNLNPYTADVNVSIQSSPQWIVETKINGVPMQGGGPIGLAGNQTAPVEITLVPYAEGPDTESYCVSLMYGSKTVGQQCITLAVTNIKAAVSTDQPNTNITLAPNPAGSYISIRGLENAAAEYSYEIYSMTGAEVLHGLLPSDVRINVKDLSSGAYRLLLSDGKQMMANTPFTVLH